MIQRVYEQARKMKTADRVIVATDDERVVDAVRSFGGEAMMTSPEHQSGTDRAAEVALSVDSDIIVNIQGDEPFIDPEAVDSAVRALLDNPEAYASTLCVKITPEEAEDPNVTLVTRDLAGYALYFSKLPIPNDRDGDCPDRPLLKHLGTYVYRRDLLLHFADWPQTPLERCEKLEQLRILERGVKILCVLTGSDSIGVDSPEDLSRAEMKLKSGVIDD